MENKEIKKIEPTFAADKLKGYSDTFFEVANKNLGTLRLMLIDLWKININKNKDLGYKNPFDNFIEMLEWYVKDSKELYAKLMKENGFKLSKEDKKDLAKLNSQDKNKPAEVVYAKQVKELILG